MNCFEVFVERAFGKVEAKVGKSSLAPVRDEMKLQIYEVFGMNS
jgi:hypothetical protein